MSSQIFIIERPPQKKPLKEVELRQLLERNVTEVEFQEARLVPVSIAKFVRKNLSKIDKNKERR